MARQSPPYLIPHSEHGEPHCPGFVFAIPRAGGVADFRCNDCGAVVCTVPLNYVAATILAMRMDGGEGVALICPHCNEMNEFQGYTEMFAFDCRDCGEGVTLARAPK
jgi:hypothetical protein